ncbi:MAG: VWA domain-containing protein [Helicobacteraceae bacterium]|jgi:Ca-activated chloride channel family protein|nr:VWA domain-containing protein [Helicobacteraceae bacterium]
MQFKSPEFLLLLILLLPFAVMLFRKGTSLSHYFEADILKKLQLSDSFLSPVVKNSFLLLSSALMIAALARPYIDNGEIKVSSSTIDVMAAFDISRSMFANDVYPNRLALAKKKFKEFSGDFQEAKIGVIGFSSRAFLISPLTEDFATLDYLVKNMNLDSVRLRGTSVMNALEVTNDLLKESEKKALILFSDGGDNADFSEEIAYAKKHNIVLFAYNIGTTKGGIIPDEKGALTDAKGDIVVVRLNEKIKELALQSGGAYMEYSLKNNDIDALAQAIKQRFSEKNEEESTIRDVKELFYYPLSAALVLLFIALYSMPSRRRKDV